MSRIASAIVAILVTTFPMNHAIATESQGQNLIVIQKWHSGVWVAWDRSSQVKSALVAVKPTDEFRSDGFLSYRSYFLNDFSYISLIERETAFPFKGEFLVSVYALDFEADGRTTPPTCSSFHSYPLPRGERVLNDPRCLSETIFQVTIDLTLKAVKKIQQEGVTFVGVRDVNRLGSSTCQLGWSQTSGKCEIADRLLYEVKRDRGGKILYFDSIIHLPKIAKKYVGVQSQFRVKKKGPTQWFSISSLSSDENLWRKQAVVVNRYQDQESDAYRHMVWDSTKKRYIWFGQKINVAKTLQSSYGFDENLGGMVEPVFTSDMADE